MATTRRRIPRRKRVMPKQPLAPINPVKNAVMVQKAFKQPRTLIDLKTAMSTSTPLYTEKAKATSTPGLAPRLKRKIFR